MLGCRRQFAQLANGWRTRLLHDVDQASDDSLTQQIIALSAQLTRLPERFSAAHLQPLLNAGWGSERLFTLMQAVAFASWQDRLLMALGEAR